MSKDAFRGRSGLNLDILEQVALWAEVGWIVLATLGIFTISYMLPRVIHLPITLKSYLIITSFNRYLELNQ